MKKARGKAAAKHNMAKAAAKAAANNVAATNAEEVKTAPVAEEVKEVCTEESKAETVEVFTEESKTEAVQACAEESKTEAVQACTEESKAEAVQACAEECKAETVTVTEVPAENLQEAQDMEVKPEITIQYRHNEADMDQIIQRVKEDFAVRGNHGVAVEKIQVYVKPEDFTAYYVINDSFAGKVSLF